MRMAGAIGAIAIMGGVAAAESKWAVGVPQDKQKQAEQLFEEANQLFAQQAHAPALEKYRAALALWDHPLIHFNTAVTLIKLSRPLDAASDLELSLAYGADPFVDFPGRFEEAKNYQQLLANQVGYIEATCSQAGANVLLDGKPWFACPGTQKQRVLVGVHAVVGEQKGYLTASQRIIVAAGGKTETTTVKLIPLESAVTLEYPYPRWIPATIGGAGFAIALGGLAFYAAGRSQMDEFESQFASECATGCPKELDGDNQDLADTRDSAKLKGTIGITMMIAGGVAFVGGVVGFLADKPKRVLPTVEVAPTAGGAVGTVGWRF